MLTSFWGFFLYIYIFYGFSCFLPHPASPRPISSHPFFPLPFFVSPILFQSVAGFCRLLLAMARVKQIAGKEKPNVGHKRKKIKSQLTKRSEKILKKKNRIPKKRKDSDPPNVGRGRPLTGLKLNLRKPNSNLSSNPMFVFLFVLQFLCCSLLTSCCSFCVLYVIT